MFVSAARPLTYYRLFVVAAAFSIFFSSCVVKKYPANKAFVYETNIDIEGKYTTEEKKVLKSQLEQQLHDSLRVARQRKFLFWLVLKQPPVFDTINVGKSRIYMTALLNSLGYYRGNIAADTNVKVKGDQYRTTVSFKVDP